MSLRRSVWVTLAASNLGMAIGFVSSLVLARLLTPADIGAFSIAVVLVNLVAVFRDLGVNAYLVQKKELGAEDLGAALGLSSCTAALLAAALWAGSGPFARLYGQPAIEEVLHVLTLSFLLVPYANVAAASLMRDLHARRSAAIGIGGALVHMAVAITAARAGAAHLAPAYANLANLALTVLVSAAVAPRVRQLVPRLRGWAAPLRYSVGATAENLLAVAWQALPELVLGKSGGARDVGLFSRAAGMVGLLQQALNPALQYTAGPVLARSHHAREPLGPLLAHAACLLTAVAWPALGLIALGAEPLVRLLYGPVWAESAPLVAWLALSAALRLPWALVPRGLGGIGRPGLAAWAMAAAVAARAALLLAFARGELRHFALLLTAADLLSLVALAGLARRHLGLGLRQIARAVAGSAVLGAAGTGAAATAWFGLRLAAPGAAGSGAGELPALAAAGIAAAAAWWATAAALGHPALEELRQLRRAAQSSRG